MGKPVTVSEETGSISIGVKGKLTRNLNKDTLSKVLTNLLEIGSDSYLFIEFFGGPVHGYTDPIDACWAA